MIAILFLHRVNRHLEASSCTASGKIRSILFHPQAKDRFELAAASRIYRGVRCVPFSAPHDTPFSIYIGENRRQKKPTGEMVG
jgi:hypothetical protein